MNFSKYKLQTYLTEDATAEVNSETASQKATDSAAMKNDRRAVKMASKQQNFSQPQGTAMRNKMQMSSFDAEQLRKEKEYIKMMENQKSDWRKDLQEKVIDGQERENHPYVTVMPTGDENLIQAIEQMGKEVKKKKKDAVTEEVEEGVEEEYTPQKIAAREAAGKRYREKYPPSSKFTVSATNSKKKGKVVFPPSLPVSMKKEEVDELEEDKKKKECKDGYKRDEDGNCVKKKKSSRTTIILGRGYGGHHHHDHDDDDDNDGGSDDVGGGGDGGGGMGEMFDILGDMLLQEKEMSLRDAQRAGMTKGDPKTPIDHAKLNAKRVAGYVSPKTSDKDRAK